MANKAVTFARAAMLDTLAGELQTAAAGIDHPLRVGIDGRSAAGKTTLADELAEHLRGRRVECVRVSIDEFHRPGHKWRSMRNEWTPESRLAEGLDYAAFRSLVLEPLGPGGSRRIRPRLFDSYRDEPYPEEWLGVGDRAVLVSDAGHGFMAELRELWDFRIWLEVSADEMIERAMVRDLAWTDNATDIRRRYETFWTACDEHYHERYDPAGTAHLVIDNNDAGHPRILRPSDRATLPKGPVTGES